MDTCEAYPNGWFGIYGTTNFPDWCYESYDPWLVGSILLAIKLFLVLLALAATLLYIVCYRIKDKVIIEERPTAPCRPALRTCGPCQPRVTGRCDVPTAGVGCTTGPYSNPAATSTFVLQPTRVRV